MKKQLLTICVCLMALGVAKISAKVQEIIPLEFGKIDGSPTHHGGAKNPDSQWFINLDDNVITMSATPCNYTLSLYDEDGEIVYSLFVLAGTTQVILPSTLSGDFKLRFEADTYYYYGYINL